MMMIYLSMLIPIMKGTLEWENWNQVDIKCLIKKKIIYLLDNGYDDDYEDDEVIPELFP